MVDIGNLNGQGSGRQDRKLACLLGGNGWAGGGVGRTNILCGDGYIFMMVAGRVWGIQGGDGRVSKKQKLFGILIFGVKVVRYSIMNLRQFVCMFLMIGIHFVPLDFLFVDSIYSLLICWSISNYFVNTNSILITDNSHQIS